MKYQALRPQFFSVDGWRVVEWWWWDGRVGGGWEGLVGWGWVGVGW